MMREKSACRVIILAVAAATLVTSCMPRAAVGRMRGAEFGALDESAVNSARSGLPDTAASDAAVIGDRAPHATRTPVSLAAPAGRPLPTATLAAELTKAAPASAEAAEARVELGLADVTGGAQAVNAASAPASRSPGVLTTDGAVALARVVDVDPAPPFVVLVDSVRLVDGGATYKVTGWIRNDGAESYEGIALDATFYDGSDWHFGPFDAILGCYTLAPGQSCPFSVEAYARDYTGYRLHPEGSPVKAWTGSSTVLPVTNVAVAGTVAGYVQLTGVVRNPTGSVVDVVRVSAALIGNDGAVAEVGSAVVAGEMVPGAEVWFSLSVPASVYASYTVTAEAELR